MDYTTINKYFKKASNLLLYIGAAVFVVGILLCFVGFNGYYAGIVVMILGLALVIIKFTSNAKDSDIDDQTAHFVLLLRERQTIAEKGEKRDPKLFITEGYYFDENTKCYKRGNDTKLRTSDYCVSQMSEKDERVEILDIRASLLEEHTAENKLKFKYTDLSAVELEKIAANNENAKACYQYLMEFKDNDKKIVYSAPVDDNIDTDNFAKAINEEIRKAKILA